eukprot:scaffold172196_cov40-Tisochrysis_lutea.AAC.2
MARIRPSDLPRAFTILESYPASCHDGRPCSSADTPDLPRMVRSTPQRPVGKLRELACECDLVVGRARKFAAIAIVLVRRGDQVEVIEGVNAPALIKSVADHIPEGMLDIEDEKDEEGADEDGDDY